MDIHRDQAPPLLWRETLGHVLRMRRTDLGLTLAQVSERSGVSTQYLSEIERGLKDPSSEVIEAISMVLGLALPQVLLLAAVGMQQGPLELSAEMRLATLTSVIAGARDSVPAPRAVGRAQLSLVA